MMQIDLSEVALKAERNANEHRKKSQIHKNSTQILSHFFLQKVVMCATLRSKATKEEFCVATTHLKARTGALLSTLRNEQGKDLVDFVTLEATEGRRSSIIGEVKVNSKGHRAVICCGDFNAEPTEPVYATMTTNELK